MPAKAGIQGGAAEWIPAFAGMTNDPLRRLFLQSPHQGSTAYDQVSVSTSSPRFR